MKGKQNDKKETERHRLHEQLWRYQILIHNTHNKLWWEDMPYSVVERYAISGGGMIRHNKKVKIRNKDPVVGRYTTSHGGMKHQILLWDGMPHPRVG